MNKRVFWISDKKSFYDIDDNEFEVKIDWSKNICSDFRYLSNCYFDSAYKICFQILNDTVVSVKDLVSRY